MSSHCFQIAVLYNEDNEIAKGDPQDLLAIQYTATTAQHLYDAIHDLGYPVTKIVVRGSLEDLEDRLASYSPKDTFLFNNCDSFAGDNQAAVKVIRLVERMGFKHTGALAEAIDLCIDKPRSKARLLQAGIPTPRYQVFTQAVGEIALDFPVIVKPSVEDGSIGIEFESVVRDRVSLFARVQHVLELYHEPVMIEEFIVGRELAAAMLGNGTVHVLPLSEDDFSYIADPLQRVLTYESKWDTQSPYYQNIPSVCPAALRPGEERLIRQAAAAAFRAVGLRDFGRVDIRFKDHTPYVIDINELPDLAPDAGFWTSARTAGMSYPKMVDTILGNALRREGWMR
jgi:D-alanine-D-alanine ligase